MTRRYLETGRRTGLRGPKGFFEGDADVDIDMHGYRYRYSA